MKFVFNGDAIAVEKRESKGKVYCSINILQDNEVVQLACTQDVANVVEKFKNYNFTGQYTKGEYQGRVYSRIEVIGLSATKATA